MSTNITVKPLTPFAADVDAGDLRKLTDERFAQVKHVWLEHKVVRFRGQELTNRDLVTFGRRFGEFQPNNPGTPGLVDTTAGGEKPKPRYPDPQNPEVSYVTNLKAGDRALGILGDGEVVWHTDQSSFEVTPSATILYALETPAGEGRTEFLDIEQAYAALPEALRRRAEGLELKHDDTYDSGGNRRAGYAPVTDVRTSPGAIHPLVTTHPETGRRALYLGRRPNAYLVGLSVEESEALLDQLWAHAVQERFIWRQEWQPGDVLVWDNRSVLHHRKPFDPNARRMMRRVCIKGSKPQFVPA
ncbi:MAG TPA: TauD/TfdA family dioxygenase [Burkholderiales bacterium]|nr:TauD/TfdA family dioxygenase [Burkholderiales bacterium]